MPSPTVPSISTRELQRFAADGFLVLPDLVPTITIDAIRAEADAVLHDRLGHMVATRTRDPRVTWWRLTSGRPFVLKIKPVVDLSATAASVAESDAVRAGLPDRLGARPALL